LEELSGLFNERADQDDQRCNDEFAVMAFEAVLGPSGRTSPTSVEYLVGLLESLGDEVLCRPLDEGKAAIILTLETCPSIETLQRLASRKDRLQLIEQALLL
jgi:hypothetical protein